VGVTQNTAASIALIRNPDFIGLLPLSRILMRGILRRSTSNIRASQQTKQAGSIESNDSRREIAAIATTHP
jgi:hypothetical protein